MTSVPVFEFIGIGTCSKRQQLVAKADSVYWNVAGQWLFEDAVWCPCIPLDHPVRWK